MARRIDYYDKQPEFLGNTIVEISVPSGKLIAGNDLRSVPYFDVELPLSISSGVGCDAWAKEFAEKANGALASVGNSSPTVVRMESDRFHFVNGARNGEISVAWICTDLWAVMLTDYQNWLDNGGEEVTEDDDYTVFDVTPGKYRWTVFSHADNFDPHARGRVLYAALDLIEAY